MKRKAIIIAIVLISITITFSFIIYELGFKSQSIPSSPFSGALWQRPIEHFANGLAVSSEKVITTDNSGNVNCFDNKNGESFWNSSLIGGSHDITFLGNRVYVGFINSQVGCFDLDTGALLWSFNNAQAPNSWYEGSPRIIVNDGRVFAITNTISAHNATTGEFLWQAIPNTTNFNVSFSQEGQMNVFPLSGDPFDGKYVYAIGGDFSEMYYFKINTENGSVIWRSSVTWDGTFLTFGADIQALLPRVLAISQEKVIINIIVQEDYGVNLLLCLDSTTGKELWRIDVGAKVYNPAVYNDLLLFGAADDYFYALDLADGTVAWKTKVDAHNLSSSGVHSSSPIQIDSDNQWIFWSYAVEEKETSNYTGAIISLNLADGNVMWTTQTNSSCGGLAFNNLTDMLFLTTDRFAADIDFWIFNASTGDLIHYQQFDHYILPPIVLENETFVAADLWLSSYS